MNTFLRGVRLVFALFLAGTALAAVAANTATVTSSVTSYSAAGGTVSFTVTLGYSAPIAGLDFTVTTPAGWKYVSAAGTNIPQTTPVPDDLGAFGLGFAYSAFPTSPASFSFTVSYPAGMTGSKAITAIQASFTDDTTGAVSVVTIPTITLAPPPALSAVQSIASQTLTDGSPASSFVPVTAQNGYSPYSYAITPALPSGLALNSTTGAITGTPTAAAATANYTITVTDAVGATATQVLSLTVNTGLVAAAGTVATRTLTATTAAVAFTPLPLTGGTTPYAFTVTPALPTGLVLSPSTGAISGTAAAAAASAVYTVVGSDAAGAQVTQALTLTVNPALVAAQAIATKVLVTNVVATPFTPVTMAGGTSALFYTIVPALPAGLSLAAASGAISGTPTVTQAASTFTVNATDAVGATANASFTLGVYTVPTITSQPTTQTIVAGSPVTMTVVATGSPAPTYQWKKGGVNIAGATGSNYTIEMTAATDTGSYTVVATNLGGSVTSSAATLTVNVPPSITTQPQSAAVIAGQGASFTVVATGIPTPTYQWKKDGLAIAGATTATLALSALQPADSGSYAVVVTNAVSAVSSAAATLTVYTVPTITTQPTTQTIVAGSPVTMTVVATGSPAPTYQWKKGGVAIAGATGSSYTIEASASTNAGSYTVFVANLVGSVTSSAATLTVNVPPSITTQPQSAAITAGQGASFTVAASGIPTPTVQWERQAANTVGFVALTNTGTYSGVATSTLTVTNAALAMSGDQFRATVANGVGAAISSAIPAVLTVYTVTTITSQPTTQTIVAGSPVTMTVVATGSPAPTYQWKKGGAAIAGATGSNYTIEMTAATDTGSYTVVATNLGGSVTSSAATLTVNVPPSITTQPQSAAVTAGQGVSFTVVATGIPTPTYQWKKDGLAIEGATTATLALSALQPADSGSYAVVVTNAASAVSSAAATLTVTATPLVNATAYGRYVLSRGQTMTLQLDPAITGATVQWRRNGMDIGGATGRSATISSPGYYQARYTVGAQTTTSAPIFVLEALQRSQIVGLGANSNGELSIPAAASGATAITAGAYSSSALKSEGSVVSWGWGSLGRTDVPAGLSSVVAVSTSNAHSVALKSDGTVVAWGKNDSGQTTVPTGLTGVVAVAAGVQHSLAVKSDGTVVIWGNSASGAIQLPADLGNVATVAAGYQFSVALRSDGTVVAWGRNENGQTTVPAGLAGVTAIAAGESHVLALKSDGTIVAWGSSWGGQATVPTGLSSVVAIAAGRASLALKVDGTVVAWGDGSSGKTPTGLNLVRGIADGYNHSLVLRESAQDISPVIATPPAAQTAYAGQNVTLSVGVNVGTGYATTYQWRKGGTNIAGATAATLGLPRIAAADAGSYDVIVTNWLGSATSAAATVTVNATAAVAMNVSGQRVIAPGGNLNLTATTVLPGPVTYQWRKNGQPIANATGASYTVANATLRSSGVYQVVVTNSAGPLFGPAVFVSVSVPTQVRAWGLNTSGQTTVPLGLTNAISVAAGSDHTLALKSDGTVIAWGANTSGQATIPAGLNGVAAVAASGNYSMALRADGTVVTWGGTINYTPAGLSNVIAIAAGSGAMALRADGTVVVWDGTSVRTDTPAGLDGVSSIAGGSGGHFLAAKMDGSVASWGTNNYGVTNVPVGLASVIGVAAGERHSLALKSDGAIVAWGDLYYYGTLSVPAGLTTAIAIAAGQYHSVALRADGTVAVWGSSSNGQATVPVDLTNAFAIAAGSSHVVALRDTSLDTAPAITTQPVAVSALKGTSATFSVVATGTSPLSYQWSKGSTAISGATTATLTITGVQPADAGNYVVTVSNGVGSVTSSAVALTVPETPTFTAQPAGRTVVALGGSATLTGAATGATTYQWKRNGQVITGATGASLTITAATSLKDGGWYQLVASNATGPTSSAPAFVNVSLPARVIGWGQNSAGQTAVPAGLSNLVSLATGEQFALALRADGTVAAWGTNNYSQATVPMGLSSVVAVGAGYYHSLAVKSDGTLVAWGYNAYGMSTIPSGLSSVVAAAGGYYHSLALKSDGTVVAWGSNENGQTSVPLGLTSVTAVAAGSAHNLALKADGTVVAWGSNIYGQTTVPLGLTSVVSLVAGSAHSIALKADGTVVAWGNNNSGQTTVPAGLSSVVAIAAGSDHSLALKADGTVVAWGYNGSGQTKVPIDSASFFAINGGGSFNLGLYDNRGDLAPSIATQPQSQSANRGKIVTLSVGVSTGTTVGTTYQWRKGGAAITGATTTQYQIAGLTEAEAGTYDVVVTNYLGTVTSAVATVTLNAAPVVNSENSGRYLLSSGQTLTLQLDPGITGAGVQWRRNGMDIGGATGRDLVASSPGYYQAHYTVGAQTVTSAPIFVIEALQRSQILGWGSNNYSVLNIPPTASGATAITAGEHYSSALKSEGSVVSWGNYNAPSGLSSVVALSTSSGHSVALKSDGTVVAWGNNNSGQTTVPAGLTGVVAVAAGSSHSLAVKADGTVVAWGNTASGAIQPPADLGNVATVAAGEQFSVALKSDGTVVAWGRNDAGQTTVPAGLAGVTAIAAGQSHVVAQKSDGTVVAWGNNSYGQTASPSGLSSVVAVAAGQQHSLALKSDGTVVAWGRNYEGQTTVPPGLNLVRGIAGGSYHSLVLRESAQDISPVIATPPAAQSAYAGQNVTLSVGVNVGTGYATTYQWRKGGSDIAGATSATLGLPRIAATDAGSYDVIVTNWLGSATSAAAVVTVNAAAAVSMNVSGQRVIAAGGSQALTATTLLPGPVTYQWRKNGQPIAGASSTSYTVANATVRSSGVYQVVVTNSAGPLFGPAVFVSVNVPTQVRAWGLNTSGQTTVPAGLTNATAVAAGSAHTLALKSDGTVVAWGDNGSGQATIPTGLSGVAAVAASGNYSMALKADGTVVTWGGSINYTPTGLSNVIAIAAGSGAMALRSDGTVVVWDGSSVRTDTPVGLDGVISIAAGIGGQYLAAKTDGSVVAWGYNGQGQTNVPAGLTSVVAVAAGGYHSLALKSDGTVAAWGNNTDGQTNVPAALGGVVAISASLRTSFALRNDDTVVAWGSDENGVRSLPAGLSNSFLIAAGSSHALALRDSSADAAPAITTPPASQIASFGQTVPFAVAAKGVPTPSYQWRFNGSTLSGATAATYTLTNAQSYQSGSYDVVVSNYLGTATSSAATLLVGSAPSIGGLPASQSVGSGGTVQLAVGVGGNTPFAYQWRKNSTPIPGATASFLRLGNFQAGDAGNYDVVVANPIGSTTSGTAVLSLSPTALTPPTIIGQPVGGTIFVGNVAAFFVSASGPGPLYYQWRKDGIPVAGATNPTYIQTNSPLSHAGAYDVVIANLGGAVTSTSASLGVVPNPGFVLHPSGQSAGAGGTVVLTARAIGDLPLNYQWRKDGAPVAGATAASLRVANFQGIDVGAYDVVVTNPSGSATSNSVALALSVGAVNPPAITSQPVGGAIFSGCVAAFFSSATGTGPLYYQWRKDGVNIAGATNTSYIQGGSLPAHSGNYDVMVSNLGGAVLSNAASLLVVPNPGFVTHPLAQPIGAGGTVVLTARAIGDLPLTYQWRRDGTPLAGATDTALRVADFLDAAVYDVVVTNPAGSANSSAAALTLATGAVSLPVITTQPVGATVNETFSRTFSVGASGTAPLYYQWRKNGVAIVGATTTNYLLTGITPASAGTFDVVVSNASGAVPSASAVLNVNPIGVTFTTQPINVAAYVGTSATLTVAATGVPSAPTWQWRKNGVAIPGATRGSLVFSSAQLADNAGYDVVATNSFASSTSTVATLTVTDVAPTITAAPVSATLAVGGGVTLTVTAVGSVPFSYQWKRDGSPITGATTSSFAIVNAQTFDAGLYSVVVTNAVGSVTSGEARLNVVPRVVAYSARLQIDPDGAVAVFTVEGTLPKKVLLRAVGPGLAPFGFAGLPDPQLELFNSAGTLLAINNDWASSADAAAITTTTAAVGAFALTIGSRDSAVLATLAPGTYTVRAKPASGPGGTGYLELYDADLATGPMSTLPYVAVRGRMGAGGGVVIGGLGSNGRGQRSYLVRAIGATLGLPGAHANPAMLIVRDGTLVGSNDDWDSLPADAAATTAANARVATFPLPAGARDAALVLTGNLHAGACTVQVGGSDALGGTVLLELHDLDAARPAAFAPAIVSSPVTTTAIAGEAVTLRVLAQGTAPLSYQWRKDGIPLDGATAATLALASVQAGQGGSYTVLVANTLGAATSLSAVLSVQSGGGASAATQAVVGGGYAAGGTATITNTLIFASAATGLGWKVTLPLGWSLVSDAGMLGDVRPVVGTVGTLEWAWSTPPVSPVTFSYTVRIPPGVAGDQFMASSGIVRIDGSLAQPIATPSPLLVAQITTHTADTNADFRISLVELTRVIELYNTRNGSSRTGCYAVATTTTEDAFAPEPTRLLTVTVALPRYHSADPDRDGRLSLVELTRVIELYNTRAGTSRTGAYHAQASTEDGFAPGP